MSAVTLERFLDKSMQTSALDPLDAELGALDARERHPHTSASRKTAAFARSVTRALNRVGTDEPAQEAEETVTTVDSVYAAADDASDDATVDLEAESDDSGAEEENDDDNDDGFVVDGEEALEAEAEAREQYPMQSEPQFGGEEPTMSLDEPAAKKRATHTSNAGEHSHAANGSGEKHTAKMADASPDAKNKQKGLLKSISMKDTSAKRNAALVSYIAAIASDQWTETPCMVASLTKALENGDKGDDRRLLLSTTRETLADFDYITREIRGVLATARQVDAGPLDAICEMVTDAKKIDVGLLAGDANMADVEQCAVLGEPVPRAAMRDLIVTMQSGATPRYRVHKSLAQLVVHVHVLREFPDVVGALVRDRTYKLRRKIKVGTTTRAETLALLANDNTNKAVLKVAHKKLTASLEAVCRSALRVAEARKDVPDDDDAASAADGEAADMDEDADGTDESSDEESGPLGADDDAYGNGVDF